MILNFIEEEESSMPDVRFEPNEYDYHEEGFYESDLEEDLEYLHRLRRIDFHRRVKEEIWELEQKNGVHRTFPNRETNYFNDRFTC